MPTDERAHSSWKALRTYADHLGMTFRPVVEWAEPIYDGTAVQEMTSTEDLAHEIAHWVLAGPDRHHEINYGLGGDFQWFDADASERASVPKDDRDAEELNASALGIWFEYHAGGNWTHTWWDHSWCLSIDDDWDAPCAAHQTNGPDRANKDITCPDCVSVEFVTHSTIVAEQAAAFVTWLTDTAQHP